MRLDILLAILPAALAMPSVKRDSPAPLIMPRDESTIIPGKYIVKLKEGSSASALSDTLSLLAKSPEHVYSSAFSGFAATLDKKTLDALRDQPNVDYIEPDAKVSINTYVSQKKAPWGLVRISHRQEVGVDYRYGDTGGAGSCVYVLDTGVEASHPEFQGRAAQIKTFIGTDNTDGNGHGTHVAGTVGSKNYGVAKKTKIYGVKVLDDDGNGEWSGVIAGMDFVIKDSVKRSCPKGVAANLSLSGSKIDSVNAAAAAMIKKNIFVAVAAGNFADNTAYYSPSSEPTVCTVGAIEKGNYRAYYSNYGALVDIFAPGSEIKSTWIGGTTNTIDGTSMASPHIAGLAAYIMGREKNPGAQALCTKIKNLGTSGILKDIPSGTTNRLAFNGNPTG